MDHILAAAHEKTDAIFIDTFDTDACDERCRLDAGVFNVCSRNATPARKGVGPYTAIGFAAQATKKASGIRTQNAHPGRSFARFGPRLPDPALRHSVRVVFVQFLPAGTGCPSGDHCTEQKPHIRPAWVRFPAGAKKSNFTPFAAGSELLSRVCVRRKFARQLIDAVQKRV